MRRACVLCVLLLAPRALAQMAPQTWDADQIGANNTCTDVGYFQANNLSGVGDRCVKTDATGKLIPASFDCVDPASLANTQFQDASLGLLPKEPVIGTGFTNGSICAVDDPGSTRTDIDLCPVSPVDSGAGTLLVSRVISNGVGQLSFASTIGLASDMTESGGNLTQADYPLVSRATNAPATAQNLGAIATAPLGCVTSGGVCTVDGLTLSGGLHFNTGTGAETLDSFTCSANQFVSSSSTSGLACTQPAFSDLSGSEACSQTPAFTGDVTKSAGSCTTVLANIPNDTPAVGDILFTAIAAPSTPAAGKGRLYEDSGSKNFALKNDAGTVNHGIQDKTCGASTWISTVAASGASTCTQPAFSDVSGSATCAQLPALTGAVTSAGGTCATSYAGMPTATQIDISNGATSAPVGDSTLTYDTTNHILSTGATQVNGATAASSDNLVVGHTTNTDRDRTEFFLGGGTLGPTGTGDSTLFDLNPSNTSMNGKSATGGIYATERVRALTYTGGSLGDHVSVAATIYVDGAPTLTVVGGTPYALYVAAGATQFGGNVTSTGVITGARLNANGSSNAFTADGSSGTPAVGFFGAGAGAGVVQQTGGAATAGATYTATEQGMINRMYSALRTYGLLN